MTRGSRIAVWGLGLLLLAAVGVYLNETTVREQAVKEVESGLQCALGSGTDLTFDEEQARDAVLTAINDYCMWGVDRHGVYISKVDVDVTQREVSPQRIERVIEVRLDYRTGEVLPVQRKKGMRCDMAFDPQTLRMIGASPSYTPL